MEAVSRTIGGRVVGGVALGCSGLSLFPPPRQQAIDTIRAALDAGMRLLDTAAVYVPDAASQGHNELLVAEAVRSWSGNSGEVVIVSKGGHARVGDGHNIKVDFEVCGRPEYIWAQAEATLKNLEVDALDVHLLHQPDPAVPIEESMGALDELRRQGKARIIGVCNATVDQLEECQKSLRIDAVQNAFSPLARDRTVLAWCERNSVSFLAHSALGGLFGPRVDEFPSITAVAARHGVSPHRVALAWELAQSEILIPLAGCRRPATARDSAAAMSLALDDADLELLQQIDADAAHFDGEGNDERQRRLESRLDYLIAAGGDA